jgi:hypothetical protein
VPDSVVLDPPLADRAPVDPALAPPDEVLSVGLTLPPFELDGEELDADDLDADADAELRVDGLALTDGDVDVVALGLAVVSGAAVGFPQGLAVASAVVLPPFVLGSDVAGAVAEAVVVALLGGVLVALAVAVAGLVAAVLSLGLALLVAGLALVLVAGLVAVPAGVALGLGDLLALCEGDSEGDSEELDGHAVTCALLARLPGMLLGPAPPAEEPIGLLPAPSVPWATLPLWEVIPTAVPSWTKACRSGGTARATPMANTAQAAARPDRSSPYRQSRGWRRS